MQRSHIVKPTVLELLELLLGSSCLGDLQDVEPHCLAERSAFSNCNDVTYSHVPKHMENISDIQEENKLCTSKFPNYSTQKP